MDSAADSLKRTRLEAVRGYRYAQDLTSDDHSTAYQGWINSLRAAVNAPPLIKPAHMSLPLKSLGWNGKGDATISVSASSPATSILRLSVAPWCTQPIVYKLGQKNEDIGLVSTDDFGPTIPNNFRMYDILDGDPNGGFAGAQFTTRERVEVTNHMYGEAVDSRVVHIGYTNTTIENAMLASQAKLTNQQSGSIYNPDLDPFPSGQFMGGWAEFKITTQESSSCSLTAIGQSETRLQGTSSLDALSQWQINAGLPNMYDFVQDPRAFQFGRLQELVTSRTMVGNFANAEKTICMPIIPTRVEIIQINSPGQSSQFLMFPSFVSNTEHITTGVAGTGYHFITPPAASEYLFDSLNAPSVDVGAVNARSVPSYGTGAPFSFGTWFCVSTSCVNAIMQDTAAVAPAYNKGIANQTPISPFLRIHHNVVSSDPTWTDYVYQNFNVDSINCTYRCKLARCTSNMAQCLKAGMPQLEVETIAGNTVVYLEYKMFYNMIVEANHPMYEQAVYSVDVDTTAASSALRNAGHISYGETAKQAASNWYNSLVNKVRNWKGLVDPSTYKGLAATVMNATEQMSPVVSGLQSVLMATKDDFRNLLDGSMRSLYPVLEDAIFSTGDGVSQKIADYVKSFIPSVSGEKKSFLLN